MTDRRRKKSRRRRRTSRKSAEISKKRRQQARPSRPAHDNSRTSARARLLSQSFQRKVIVQCPGVDLLRGIVIMTLFVITLRMISCTRSHTRMLSGHLDFGRPCPENSLQAFVMGCPRHMLSRIDLGRALSTESRQAFLESNHNSGAGRSASENESETDELQ